MGEGGAGASAQVSTQGGGSVDELAAAHAELLRDKALQLKLTAYQPPVYPPWLRAMLEGLGRAIGQGLQAAGPVLKVLFWAGLALIVVLIGVFVVRDVMQVGKRWRRVTVGGQAEWRPDLARALVLLEDADALAAEGRFEAAAHLLLLRGVQDVQSRRPRAVRPALTSREIATSPELPSAARAAFAPIADVVERSFYGEQPVDHETWLSCRGAYERLVFPSAWAA